MTKELIYDEEEKSKFIYENGFKEDGYTWESSLLVAKYLRYTMGMGDSAIKTNLNSFIIANDPFFSLVTSIKTIRTIVVRSKNEFRKTGIVNITKSELEFIRTIKNFKLQKIILAILFIAKRSTNKGYVNRKDWPDIKKTLSSRVVNQEIKYVFNILYKIGKIKIISGGKGKNDNNAHQILFMENDGEVIFSIKTDMEARNLGNIYKKYYGGELGYCGDCQKEFIKNSSRHIWCKECSIKKGLEKRRKWKNTKYHK